MGARDNTVRELEEALFIYTPQELKDMHQSADRVLDSLRATGKEYTRKYLAEMVTEATVAFNSWLQAYSEELPQEAKNEWYAELRSLDVKRRIYQITQTKHN